MTMPAPTAPLVLIAALILAVAPAHGDDRLTIAAYNIENAFDVFDDPYTEDELSDVKQRWELEAIAGAIRALDADVVAFSELENEHVLLAMTAAFLSDLGYHYIASGPTNSGRGINLGLISRRPILRLTSHRFCELTLEPDAQIWRFARDVMQVTIQATDHSTVELFIVHFKSKRSSRGDPQSARWRLAEATAARRIIDALLAADPTALLAIVGDINDTPDSAVIRALQDGKGLVDVHAPLLAEQRLTYLREPYLDTVDYILVSPALARRLVPGSAKVLTNEVLLQGSDHAPLAATFDFGTP